MFGLCQLPSLSLHFHTFNLTIASVYFGLAIFLVSAYPHVIFLAGFQLFLNFRARGAVFLNIHGLCAFKFPASCILNLIAVCLFIPLPLHGNRFLDRRFHTAKRYFLRRNCHGNLLCCRKIAAVAGRMDSDYRLAAAFDTHLAACLSDSHLSLSG